MKTVGLSLHGDCDMPLLGPHDPAPFETVNPDGKSPVLLVCEHAGLAVPHALGDLGIERREFARHIACDIGSESVARALSSELDATLILQPYTRLVIDCNRPLTSEDCIPVISDGTTIPANRSLSQVQRQQRGAAIHKPFHRAIAAHLDRKSAAGLPAVLVTVHSFVPRLRTGEQHRPWQLGLLYNRDRNLSERMMYALTALTPSLRVAYNEPYTVTDMGDYSIPVHGEARGLPHVLLEIRNDQIRSAGAQARWATLLGTAVRNSIRPYLSERQ